jgi:triacylglycerol lipase
MSPLQQVLAQLRALDPEFNMAQIAATRDILAPRVPRPDPAQCVVQRDVAYGPDPRQRLDVFAPLEPAAAARTVFVYVHGGGFVQGDKGAADAPFFNNVGAWAVRQGYVGVTVTYRLAPAHPWPAGSADLHAAVEWLRANVAAVGGDPQRIVLCGQSAGATHVAGYIAGHGRSDASRPPLAAAVLVSGVFDLTQVGDSINHAAYYGADRSVDAQRSTLDALARTSVPCLYVICENDPAQFQRQAAAVLQACMAQRGVLPPLIHLAGHNHVSSVLQVGSDVDTLGPQLQLFIEVGAGLAA